MPTSSPHIHITAPETFILESLSMEDEEADRRDGRVLYDILKLHKKKPIYYYFRTQAELVQLSDIFRNSGYRYLHLSCHGNDEQLQFTFNSIPFAIFADIFEKKLHNRRLFISGCDLGNKSLADKVFAKNGGMYSMTAPTKLIFFNQSAAFWSAFYYLMYAYDNKKMKKAQIEEALEKTSVMFEMPMVHYFKNTKTKRIDERRFG